MINTIPGGFFEHAEDQRLHANPGFFSNSFMAPSPTGGGGGGAPHPPRGGENKYNGKNV